MAKKSKKMLTENDIIGKTLGECLDDINKKLDNHIAHGDVEVANLVKRYTDLDNKVDCLKISFEKGFATMTTEMSWIKKISVVILLSILAGAFYIIQSGIIK